MNSRDSVRRALSVARIEERQGVEAITGYREGGNGHAMFHTDYGIRCIYEGEVQLRYRGQEWRLTPGAAKLACPGEVTVIVERPQGYSNEAQVFIEPDTLREAALPPESGGGVRFLDGMITSPGPVVTATRLLVKALMSGTPLEVDDALIALARLLADLPSTSLVRRSGVEPRAVRAMRDLLVEEFAKNVTLDELAKEAGMSKYYAAHLFKSYVGVSPHRFVTGVRVGHARRLLRRGVPCGKVAERCGFSDQSHMTRHFSRLHELSPSRYARGGTYMLGKWSKPPGPAESGTHVLGQEGAVTWPPKEDFNVNEAKG